VLNICSRPQGVYTLAEGAPDLVFFALTFPLSFKSLGTHIAHILGTLRKSP
jgi:hypothetical protein